MQTFQELFRGIQNESHLEMIDINSSTHKSVVTMGKVRGLIDILCSRTAVKRESLAGTMTKTDNLWWTWI